MERTPEEELAIRVEFAVKAHPRLVGSSFHASFWASIEEELWGIPATESPLLAFTRGLEDGLRARLTQEFA